MDYNNAAPYQPVAEFWPKYDAMVAAEKRAAEEKDQASRERLEQLIATSTTKATDGTLKLDLRGQNLSDVSFLKGLAISKLILQDNPLTDLSPLRGLPLRELHLAHTNVSDLTPLRGAPLEKIYFDETPVKDLRPLLEMPKLHDMLVPRAAENIELLRSLKSLEYLGWEDDWKSTGNTGHSGLPITEFWKRYDALKK